MIYHYIVIWHTCCLLLVLKVILCDFLDLPECSTCSKTCPRPFRHYIHIINDYLSTISLLVFCEGANSYPYNTVAISALQCFVENILIFEFVTQSYEVLSYVISWWHKFCPGFKRLQYSKETVVILAFAYLKMKWKTMILSVFCKVFYLTILSMYLVKSILIFDFVA